MARLKRRTPKPELEKKRDDLPTEEEIADFGLQRGVKLRAMVAGVTGGTRESELEKRSTALLSVHTFSDLRMKALLEVPDELFTGQQYRELHEARHMSERDAAELASNLPSVPPLPRVDDSALHRLETGASPNPERRLHSRLDMVYRADGHSCCERVGTTMNGTRKLEAEFSRRLPGLGRSH